MCTPEPALEYMRNSVAIRHIHGSVRHIMDQPVFAILHGQDIMMVHYIMII